MCVFKAIEFVALTTFMYYASSLTVETRDDLEFSGCTAFDRLTTKVFKELGPFEVLKIYLIVCRNGIRTFGARFVVDELGRFYRPILTKEIGTLESAER